MGVPSLVVDFQDLVSKDVNIVIKEWERTASLASPFAENVLSRFWTYLGRIGTPDLDIGRVLTKVKSCGG